MKPRQRPSESSWLEARWFPWALFALAFGLRLLFWQATPDTHWPHSVFYKGDAPTWMQYAAALRLDVPFELGLPLRPPGNAYLMAALTAVVDGPNGLPAPGWLKLVWCFLGALTVLWLHGAARRSFGSAVAAWVGVGCAVSSGLMVLSTSLNNETPYLLLVAASLRWQPRDDRPGVAAALWGAIHGVACLVRVEHLLVVVLTVGPRWLQGLRADRVGATSRWAVAVGLGLGLALLPWHLYAWSECRRFNRVEPEVNPATSQAFAQIERAIASIHWTPEALRDLEGLPAASRRTMRNFVASTILVRGGQAVGAGDVDRLLEEAFGTVPRPLAEHPLVVLYGGLNFYLAHHPDADAGFARGPLDDPPPLVGGADRYLAPLVAGLPPNNLALTYPPHLNIVNGGYALGWNAIRQDPGRAIRRSLAKLGLFWDGATLGVGGYNAPWGFDGTRHRVDLLTPGRHPGVVLWQLVWLALALVGLWSTRRWNARRRAELVPWLAVLATKLVVTVAFFGYARHGATVIPVVLLLAGLGVEALRPRLLESVLQRHRLVTIAMAGILILELFRLLNPPTVRVDGRPVAVIDPWPLDLHEDRQVELQVLGEGSSGQK